MTVIIIILIILLLIGLAAGKKKPGESHQPKNNAATKKQPSTEALELAYELYGDAWRTFIRNGPTIQPADFHKTVALALDQLSASEHDNLLLTFLGVHSEKGNQSNSHSISIS